MGGGFGDVEGNDGGGGAADGWCEGSYAYGGGQEGHGCIDKSLITSLAIEMVLCSIRIICTVRIYKYFKEKEEEMCHLV